MEKITNAKALRMAIEVLGTVEGFDAEALTKLGNIATSYEKKSSNRKPTEAQKANEVLKTRIFEIVSSAEAPMTVSDVVKALDNEYSNQKISVLMNAMSNLTKTTEKRRSYFSVA